MHVELLQQKEGESRLLGMGHTLGGVLMKTTNRVLFVQVPGVKHVLAWQFV